VLAFAWIEPETAIGATRPRRQAVKFNCESGGLAVRLAFDRAWGMRGFRRALGL